jgi:hypothetical protein
MRAATITVGCLELRRGVAQSISCNAGFVAVRLT